MKNSFAELGRNILTKKFGGTVYGTAEPYVSGYHFIWLEYIPPKLVNYTSKGNSGISSAPDIQYILAAACTRVTPGASGGTLATVPFNGIGGLKWQVPGNVDYGNTVTVQFLEFQRTPVYDILHGWVKMIRDYRTGTTDLIAGDDGAGYTKKTYSCIMYYFTTTPDVQTVEYYACFDGVFPLRDPGELFTGDVTASDKLEIEIDFNVDYAWHEPWVKTKCSNLVKNLATSKSNINSIAYT
jgi:hypothetical protein